MLQATAVPPMCAGGSMCLHNQSPNMYPWSICFCIVVRVSSASSANVGKMCGGGALKGAESNNQLINRVANEVIEKLQRNSDQSQGERRR